jgi:hypothetical protein
MTHWTDSARARLEDYLARTRQSLANTDADADEVTDDLRRHVDEEIAARMLSTVTEQDIAQILTHIGTPEPAQTLPTPGTTAAVSTPPRSKRGFFYHVVSGLLLVFGILLPFGVLVFEYATGACAGVLFDPIPNIGHAVLVALVPIVSLLVWIDLLRPRARWRAPLAWANAVTIGVAFIYFLLFLPPAPFAVIGLFFFGFGFVPLAPILSFLAALVLRRRLRYSAEPPARLPGLWLGSVLGIAALAVVSIPMVFMEIALAKANSTVPAETEQGIRWLRSWGQEDELLRACYGRTGRSGELYQWRTSITPENARIIYYRVYGRAFNAVPPPRLYAGRARWNFMEEEFAWDNDQAGNDVAGRIRGLSLATSRADAVIYPQTGLAYTEWTLEFKNDSRLQREARAQIQLPPGGVVSRLTLWIDGEEREAAFGGRSQVKTAYRQVVERRRDPVLVTTCGPDRVMMQCFPVPPDGGRMKVRVGVVSPLALLSSDVGCLRWPYFIERNFGLAENFKHSAWAESSQPLESINKNLKTDHGKTDAYALRGQLTETELASAAGTIRAHRPASSSSAWSSNTRSGTNQVIHQAIVEKKIEPPDRVILVVDGTKGMEASYPAITATLKELPGNIDVALLLARDGTVELMPLQKSSADISAKASLKQQHSDGGHDNVPALIRAWDLAAEGRHGAIVWIHGPQPVLLDSAEELRQRFDRSSHPPLLFEIQTQPGPNRVAEKLDGVRAVCSVLRLGTLEEDLTRLFKKWSGNSAGLEFVREDAGAIPSDQHPEGAAPGDHLVRLWAAQEVARLCGARKFDEATRVAARYHLVTPVTGAVVLETKEQYQQAGLQPAAPESVPTVPEPSGAALLILGLIAFAVRRRKNR